MTLASIILKHAVIGEEHMHKDSTPRALRILDDGNKFVVS